MDLDYCLKEKAGQNGFIYRLLAAPVSLEGSEKSSSSKSVIFCHLSAANAILTESLCMKAKDESLLFEDSVVSAFI